MTRRAGLLLAAALCACSKPSPGPLAVLRIENLTGDPGFDWVATAGAHALARQTSALDAWNDAPRDARAALMASGGARRFVHAVLSKQGAGLRLDATVEDGSASAPVVASATAKAGDNVLTLIDAVARGVSPSAKAYGTRDDAALRALFADSPEKALQIDQNYDEARAGSARSAGERAYLARQFGRAAAEWSEAVRVMPGDSAVWNNLGYARAYAGDLEGAIGAAREYQLRKPGDPNPLDTLGEIYFIGGRFAEAEKAFLEAFARDPRFLGGAAAAKAAQAKLAAGGAREAGVIFAKFPSKTPEAEGRWRYCSGDREKAIELLRAQTDPDSRAALLIALLAAGKREEARKAAPPSGPPLLAVAVFTTLPSASAGEWAARAAKMFGAPQLTDLRDAALAFALLLDRKPDAARPALQRMQARTRAAPNDLPSALLGERRYLDPYMGPNPFALLTCAVLGDK